MVRWYEWQPSTSGSQRTSARSLEQNIFINSYGEFEHIVWLRYIEIVWEKNTAEVAKEKSVMAENFWN